MDVKKGTVCNIKKDKDKYKKDRNICKNCYNMNRKKSNKDKNKSKVVNPVNNIINDTFSANDSKKTLHLRMKLLLPTINQKMKTLIITITKTDP